MDIAILTEDLYEDTELWYPFYRLREAGFETRLVAPRPGTYRSKAGYPAKAEVAVREVKAERLKGVVIPGGYAPDRLRRHREVLDLVREADAQGKLVAAICHGGWVLVSAGIAKGRRLTSFFAIRDDMENAGAHWVDEEAVVDGHLVTARHPSDLPAFAKAMLGVLQGGR